VRRELLLVCAALMAALIAGGCHSDPECALRVGMLDADTNQPVTHNVRYFAVSLKALDTSTGTLFPVHGHQMPSYQTRPLIGIAKNGYLPSLPMSRYDVLVLEHPNYRTVTAWRDGEQVAVRYGSVGRTETSDNLAFPAHIEGRPDDEADERIPAKLGEECWVKVRKMTGAR